MVVCELEPYKAFITEGLLLELPKAMHRKCDRWYTPFAQKTIFINLCYWFLCGR